MTALSLVVPGAVTGAPARTPNDDSAVAVTIHVRQRTTTRAASQAPAASTQRQPEPVELTAPAPAKRPAAAGGESPAAGTDASDPGPPGVIRVWHVMYATQDGSSEPSNDTPCPRASTCERTHVRAGRWPTDDSGRATIPFAYNDEGRRPVRAPDGIARPALAGAMREWSRWNSNVVFRDEGTTTATFGADGPDGTCADGTNVVTWSKFGPNVIGAAVICFDETGRIIRDADLALNSTQHWEAVASSPDSRHSHDIQSIYTHELGHWLALEDIYSPDSARQTMHGNTEYGQTRKRTLARGDITGVQKAYPCSAGDRCPRSGITDD